MKQVFYWVKYLVVVLGGTAFNGVIEELKKLTVRVAHVLPVSDDGGSTAEIVRVLGKFHQFLTQNVIILIYQLLSHHQLSKTFSFDIGKKISY